MSMVTSHLTTQGVSPFDFAELLRWVSILLCSSLSEVTVEKSLEELSLRDCNVLNKERITFLKNDVLAFPATRRGDEGEESWASQRDATQRLIKFERSAFEMSRTICLSSNNTFVTIDDDLYGTRAWDNQVKSLSNRKANKEGHTADMICDALFRVTLGVRFRRRGESQATNLDKLLDSLLEGHG